MRTPPFRPFLAGAPQLVPGLKPIPPEAWLEPDTEAGVWLDEKRALMRSHRRDVFGAIGADAEMAELAAQVSAVKGEAEEDWPTPLEAAASLVSDDLCLLCSSTDGLWRLKAASLCAPTFWRLDEKLGEPLGGLHAPVPGANPGLVSRISRMFDALRPGQVLERFNWTVQAGDARFAPSQAASKALAASTPDEAALDTLFQRVERQTISKLPETGAVVFTIRIVLDPLRAVLTTPGDVRAFREAWAHVSPDLHAYKGWPAYDRLVAAALQRCAG
jgi:hypothetical protein